MWKNDSDLEKGRVKQNEYCNFRVDCSYYMLNIVTQLHTPIETDSKAPRCCSLPLTLLLWFMGEAPQRGWVKLYLTLAHSKCLEGETSLPNPILCALSLCIVHNTMSLVQEVWIWCRQLHRAGTLNSCLSHPDTKGIPCLTKHLYVMRRGAVQDGVYTPSAHNYDTDRPITVEHYSNSAILQEFMLSSGTAACSAAHQLQWLVTGHLDGDTINTV